MCDHVTAEVNYQSTPEQRRDPVWRARVTTLLSATGAHVEPAGGGTDLLLWVSDNHFIVHGTPLQVAGVKACAAFQNARVNRAAAARQAREQ